MKDIWRTLFGVVLFRGTWRTLEACRSTTPRRCSVCMTTPTSLSHRTRPTRCWPRCCCCSPRSAQAADAHSRRYNVVILCSFAPGLTIGSVQELKMETHPSLSSPPLLFSFPLLPHFPLSYCFFIHHPPFPSPTSPSHPFPRDTRNKHFVASSMEELFRTADVRNVLDFIKETHFYNQKKL